MTFKVGIDYLPAVCHAPGVGRYARELVRALVHLDERPELALFELGRGARVIEPSLLGLDGAEIRRLSSHLPRTAVRWLHRLTGVGADQLMGGVDLFHASIAPPPLGRASLVLPVSELPPVGSTAERHLARTARSAAAVVVFSRHYATLVSERLGVEPERVAEVPVGCDHWLRDGPPETPLPPKPQLLVLGAVRAGRHPLVVLEAFERLRREGVEAELAMIGRPGSHATAFETALIRSPAAGTVRWVRQPLEAEMPHRMARATALVHLSDDEGSPVTPLEAFSFGAEVVASRLPSYEEALGDEALWVDHSAVLENPALLTARMAEAVTRRGDTERAARRRAIAAQFSWSENARRTVRVWQHIVAAERAPRTADVSAPRLRS